MKVVCINNGEMDGAMNSSVSLTIGKVYEADTNSFKLSPVSGVAANPERSCV